MKPCISNAARSSPADVAYEAQAADMTDMHFDTTEMCAGNEGQADCE